MPSFLVFPIANVAIIVLLFSSLLSNTSSRSTGMEQCSSNLLPLAPCAPFVQGFAPLPVQSCCDNLRQVYIQQPTCLCLLLNETNLSSFPINTALALQLPLLCNLQMDTCTGTTLSSNPPTSQVAFGPKPNSTLAASPVVMAMPRPNVIGFGLHHNGGVRSNAQGQFVMLLLMAISFVFISILH